MRILVLGASVIGSVYAGTLLQAGHHVVLLASPAVADDRTGTATVSSCTTQGPAGAACCRSAA